MRILLVFVIILLSTGCGSSSIKLNINSEKVQSLYNMATPIEDATILKNLYENPNTFENQYILSISINNYLNEQNEVIKSISKNIVEEYVYKIFGDIFLLSMRRFMFFLVIIVDSITMKNYSNMNSCMVVVEI